MAGRRLKVVSNWSTVLADRIGHIGKAKHSRRQGSAFHMIDRRCCRTVVERSHDARTGWSHWLEAHQSADLTVGPRWEYHNDRQRKRRGFDMMGRCKCSGLVKALGHSARD
jgi:hypothetical protein